MTDAPRVSRELKMKPMPSSIAEYFGVIGGSDYDTGAWTWPDKARFQQARAEAAIERLRVAVAKLKEAREDIDNWAGYASEYFVEKHDLKGCLRGYEETLAEIGEIPE